jgi:hypothetical protein
VLKEIGTSLCDLQAEQVDDEALLGKNKMEPVGKKSRKNKKSLKEKKSDDDIPDDERSNKNDE